MESILTNVNVHLVMMETIVKQVSERCANKKLPDCYDILIEH